MIKKTIPIILISIAWLNFGYSIENPEKIEYFRGSQQLSQEDFQQNGKNGKTISYYTNGQKKEEINWKNGQMNGQLLQWFPDGKKRRTVQFINGLQEGKDSRLFANGKMRSEESFQNGKRHGSWIWWFENGRKQISGFYRNGLRDGKWMYWNSNGGKSGIGEFSEGSGKIDYYYESGKLKKHEEHHKGKAHGTWCEWFPNGNKRLELHYDMGKLKDTFTRWYETGQKMRESQYKNGLLDGQDTHWFADGKINFRRQFKEGKRHNKWEAWFHSGEKKGLGNYMEGTGVWHEFYRDGTKKSESPMVNGLADGKYYEWYNDGKKRSERSWKDGKRDGQWIEWSDTGEIISQRLWKENRPQKPSQSNTTNETPKNQKTNTEVKEASLNKLPPIEFKSTDPLSGEIEKIVRLQTNLNRDISVLVGVRYKGQRKIFSYGKKSSEAQEPPDQNTTFEIGSISKTFTGILLTDLYLRGYIDLQDPVEKFLPVNAVLPQYEGKEITLFHLATHTSSLPSMADNLADHTLDPGDPFSEYTCYDMFNFFSRVSLKSPIGSKEEYSNFGVGLLGHVLGIINGSSYEELLEKNLLSQLDMKQTTVFLTEQQKANLAPGHKTDGSETPNWNFSDCLQGAGSIKSCLLDMFKYMDANMGITNSPLLNAMSFSHQPQVETAWHDYNGLGWGIVPIDKIQLVWHNGATEGYHSFIGFNPELQLGVIVLSNYRGTDMNAIGFQVFRFLKQYKE